MLLHVLEHALIDSLKVFILVFILYFALSFVENYISKKLSSNNKVSPFFGSLLGLIPQCGISVAASDLYIKRKITVGTLVAVFLACSDEAIFILLASEKFLTVFPLLYTGFSIAINHIHYSKKLKPYIPFIDSVFLDTITFTFNRLLAVILPVFVFSFITLSTSINMALKLIIISIYIIIFPFFAFIEDITGALNIFDIAYFIMYSENLSFSIANYNGI